MITDAEKTGVFAPWDDESLANQLQAYRSFLDPQTGRIRVVTVGVPNLEQAFTRSLLACVENNRALLGLCANTHCQRLFVRPQANSPCCTRRCYFKYRDQKDPQAAAGRKGKGYVRKTPKGSRRGRPRKYPEIVAPPRSQGNEDV
jgi:hypothetical protein